MPGDAEAVRALVRAAYAHYVPRIGREPAPMSADYEALIAEGRVWIAGRPPVGVLVLIPREDHLLLDNVAVAHRARGTGVGAALLAFAEERARALGLPRIRLYTNAAMHENLAYYPRHGYTETHRTSESGFHRVYFEKPTPPRQDRGGVG
ncbi:GNAT family N-acetyltransferase [Dactylosporangium darangshiense]|uniref:GNAT family N-acetyltransferase n=1 Tax=Dactylosporangium darangshiense TaxID=579108 RepID=A0ABP8DC14_9ACTN